MEKNNVKWENELQALRNIISNLKLTGIEVFVNHNGGRKKPTYFLRDETGNTITGSWTYTNLNHYIMGYGKALSKQSNLNNAAPDLLEALQEAKQYVIAWGNYGKVEVPLLNKIDAAITKATLQQ